MNAIQIIRLVLGIAVLKFRNECLIFKEEVNCLLKIINILSKRIEDLDIEKPVDEETVKEVESIGESIRELSGKIVNRFQETARYIGSELKLIRNETVKQHYTSIFDNYFAPERRNTKYKFLQEILTKVSFLLENINMEIDFYNLLTKEETKNIEYGEINIDFRINSCGNMIYFRLGEAEEIIRKYVVYVRENQKQTG